MSKYIARIKSSRIVRITDTIVEEQNKEGEKKKKKTQENKLCKCGLFKLTRIFIFLHFKMI